MDKRITAAERTRNAALDQATDTLLAMLSALPCPDRVPSLTWSEYDAQVVAARRRHHYACTLAWAEYWAVVEAVGTEARLRRMLA